MSQLPVGWGDRNNTMSEKDRKLGGDAANKFATKSMSAYDEGGAGYKTSDEVKKFYMKQIDHQQQQQQQEISVSATPSASASALPAGWEDRQKIRGVEAKQYGVFSRNPPPAPNATATHSTPSNSNSHSTAEAALVNVATTTLDAMAQSLEQNPVPLSPEQRATFAAAMQRAMGAISKCR